MKALLVNLYAASGGPSVATHRLCRVLVEEHVDAHLLVPFGDVEVMTNRLLELIHHLVLCDNWGRKDRKRTIREFSVWILGVRMIKIFRITGVLPGKLEATA